MSHLRRHTPKGLNSRHFLPLLRKIKMRLRGLEPMYTIKNAGKERFSARHPLAVPMVVPRYGKPDFGGFIHQFFLLRDALLTETSHTSYGVFRPTKLCKAA